MSIKLGDTIKSLIDIDVDEDLTDSDHLIISIKKGDIGEVTYNKKGTIGVMFEKREHFHVYFQKKEVKKVTGQFMNTSDIIKEVNKMSKQAHRVIHIKYADPTFDIQDEKVWNFLCEKESIFTKMDCEGSGTFDVSVDTLKELANIVEDENTKKAILVDIEQAEKEGERFVLYSVF